MNQRATEYTLNKEQFEQLQTAYVNTIVDSMSNKDLSLENNNIHQKVSRIVFIVIDDTN